MQNNSEGVVSNIQRFAIQDGPGIRTTIFFKGCPLHCPWCSNPETMRLQPQIIVRDVKCIKCGRCVETCPQNAITIKDDIRIFDWGKCDSCLKCADTCRWRSGRSTTQAARRRSPSTVLATSTRLRTVHRNMRRQGSRSLLTPRL